MSAFWMIFRHLPGAVKIVIPFVIGYVLVRFAVDQVWWLTAAAIVLWSAVIFWILLGSLRPIHASHSGVSNMGDPLDRLTEKGLVFEALDKLASHKERKIDVDALTAKLADHVFGQVEVCRDVALQIKMNFAKSQRKRPIGVFLLAGPPATGKTWFAKVLSEALYGKGSEFFVPMANFSQPHMASQLFGQPKGYDGSKTYGTLTGALRDKPDRVILLDEFEKAHDEVHTLFLSAWNDGFVTEASNGAHVSTTDVIFVLTTNAAQREIAELSKQFPNDRAGYSDACIEALKDHFRPEILSRIDHVFPFLPLGPYDIARVCAVQIEANVLEYGLVLERIDPGVLVGAVRKALQQNADARKIARNVQKLIAPKILAQKELGVKKVHLLAEGDEVVVVPA